jgi:beta-fructofuranosidase
MTLRRICRPLAALLLGAAVLRGGDLELRTSANRYDSPIHYRPKLGSVADVIPFYWAGVYHVFYLHAAFTGLPWEHIFSTDLIHWQEAPTALIPGGPGADGLGTGSVFEHAGTFHVFYTGFAGGTQTILHATSKDLIHWTRQPGDHFTGDGVHYKPTDFRDPFVFWNAKARTFWMLICTRDARTGEPVQGVATSSDLAAWEQAPPLAYDPPQGELTAECPDLFQIGGTWYLIHSSWKKDASAISGTFVRYARDIRGPYRPSPSPAIDTSVVYAAKSMFDGRRRIITGWVRDLKGERDGGADFFGGDQCVPREIYAGAGGQLCFRPVPEAIAQFGRTVATSAQQPSLARLPVSAEVPDNYLLDATVQLDRTSEFTVTLRQNEPGSGYRLILRPAKQEVELTGKTFSFPRHVELDAAKPVKLQIFVQGSIIECFVNDACAFTCRAYDYRSGRLGLAATGPGAKVLGVAIRVSAGSGRPIVTRESDSSSVRAIAMNFQP